jgi:hypothetical protein
VVFEEPLLSEAPRGAFYLVLNPGSEGDSVYAKDALH